MVQVRSDAKKNRRTLVDSLHAYANVAAFTAAIYAARANLAPRECSFFGNDVRSLKTNLLCSVLLEGRIDDGHVSGGQLTTTTDVENFPGFPDGINGTELVDHMKAQCVRFGTRIEPETVASVDLSDKRAFRLRTTSGKAYAAQSIIVATGAVAKKLAFDGSETYWNRGISACAVCDGALPIFRNKALVVIGGGDTAMEEASFLSKYGSQVHIVVRRDVLRASKIMQHRVKANPKIVFHYNAVVVEARGANNKLTTAVIEDVNTKAKTELAVGGIFFAIGFVLNVSAFQI